MLGLTGGGCVDGHAVDYDRPGPCGLAMDWPHGPSPLAHGGPSSGGGARCDGSTMDGNGELAAAALQGTIKQGEGTDMLRTWW